jgi:hypothetical protein
MGLRRTLPMWKKGSGKVVLRKPLEVSGNAEEFRFAGVAYSHLC